MVTPAAENPDSVLAGLGREVEQLARTVQTLRALPQRVDELAQVVVRVADATETRPADDGGELVLSWLDLGDGLQAARAVLADLAVWMRRILLRYPDAAAALPECWAWHPHVVEELLCLHQAWQTAYHSPTAGPALASDWHDRYRPGVVARIKASAGTCSTENHTPGGEHHQPAAGTPPSDQLDAAAAWWATGRDDPPPVQPTATRMNGSRR